MHPLDQTTHIKKENRQKQTNISGFSLVEILIAMAIGLIILAAIYGVFTMQNKKFKTQEQIAEMQQNARVAMDMMAREIRMAGCDPAGTSGSGIVSASADSISFTMDSNADGDTADANENITYALYTSDGIQKLGRTTGGGSVQPVAEYINSLTFTYYNAEGTPIPPPITYPDTADIRRIKITVTATTALPDPEYPVNGGYRTITLTSDVTPRNLAY